MYQRPLNILDKERYSQTYKYVHSYTHTATERELAFTNSADLGTFYCQPSILLGSVKCLLLPVWAETKLVCILRRIPKTDVEKAHIQIWTGKSLGTYYSQITLAWVIKQLYIHLVNYELHDIHFLKQNKSLPRPANRIKN